jgi:bisanhydrobacterioruberin hydratase
MLTQFYQSFFTSNFRKREIIAIVIALAFHFFGFFGMQNNIAFFYNTTLLNLIICSLLIIYTHASLHKSFFIFVGLAFIIGFGAELIGVNTSMLFGTYTYGKVLGWGIGGVPFTIGLNWFVILYCCAMLAHKVLHRLRLHLPNSILRTFLFASVTASIATLFDFIIEPGATKLLFWSWANNQIPIYNYICWWACSFIIAIIFSIFISEKNNRFAIWLLAIQAVFFIGMRW